VGIGLATRRGRVLPTRVDGEVEITFSGGNEGARDVLAGTCLKPNEKKDSSHSCSGLKKQREEPGGGLLSYKNGCWCKEGKVAGFGGEKKVGNALKDAHFGKTFFNTLRR